MKNYNKTNKKYKVVFFDDHNTTLNIGQKNVSPFSRVPPFEVPLNLKENFQKFQKVACRHLGMHYNNITVS